MSSFDLAGRFRSGLVHLCRARRDTSIPLVFFSFSLSLFFLPFFLFPPSLWLMSIDHFSHVGWNSIIWGNFD